MAWNSSLIKMYHPDSYRESIAELAEKYVGSAIEGWMAASKRHRAVSETGIRFRILNELFEAEPPPPARLI